MSKTRITKIYQITKDGEWIIANTPALDRDKDRIFPEKIDTENFTKNPALFWGHNYRDPWAMIGRIGEWNVTSEQFKFKPELREPVNENDPMQIIRSLWDTGILRAASIGFMPKDKPAPNEEGGYDYGEIELLEISLVPIPAHQDAMRMAIKAFEDELKTVVPYRDEGAAEEGESWSSPRLGAFSGESFDSLSAAERRRIARHFAWTARMPPESYGDLKLPHHKPGQSGVGPAVWRGVAAAMGALLGARGGVNIPDGDRRGVYNHLARHYAQYDKEPPDFRAYSEEEIKSLFDVVEADPEPEEDPAENAGQGSEPEPNTNESSHDESEGDETIPEDLIGTISEFIETISEVFEDE